MVGVGRKEAKKRRVWAQGDEHSLIFCKTRKSRALHAFGIEKIE